MTFTELMNQLISTITTNNINSFTLKDFNDQKEDFWKNILEYLQNENTSSRLNHAFVRNSDDITNNNETSSVIGRIDELADLNDSVFNNYVNSIKSYLDESSISGITSSNYFWNESVSKLISYYLLHFDISTILQKENSGFTENDNNVSMSYGAIPTSGQDFRISDVIDADAGRQFTKSTSSRWVRPWYNIDNETYNKVRGNDKIYEVLGNSNNLQFTRTAATNKYLRLLMPQYSRAVEVEDLDRNFWVIAQVITAISAYLFDDSPFTEIFRQILNEITQLWENILYLWAALMLISQDKYYTNLHSEVVVINNVNSNGSGAYNEDTKSYEFYKKYDAPAYDYNPEETLTFNLQKLWEKHLYYLKEQYPESNLCIIPLIRLNNYEHNYYNTECYPGVILYNRNLDVVNFINFSEGKIYIPNYKNRIGAISDTGINYNYIEPASYAIDYPASNTSRYYYFLRTAPIINATFLENSNEIQFNNFSLTLTDGAYYVYSGNSRLVGNLSWGDSGITSTTTNNDVLTTYNRISNHLNDDISTNISPQEVNYIRGYYLGDVPSAAAVTKQLDYNMKISPINLTPMGGPHWGETFASDSDDLYKMRNSYFNGGRWDVIGQTENSGTNTVGVKEHLKNRNMEILEAYYAANTNNVQSADDITLLVGSRKSDLYLTATLADNWLNEDVQEDSDSGALKRKQLIGNRLGEYYWLNDSNELKYVSNYNGRYYEPYGNTNGTPTTESNYYNEIVRYSKIGELNNHSGTDAMKSIRKGYRIKTDGTPDTSGGNLIRLSETTTMSTEPTEIVPTGSLINPTATYFLPYRYNNYRQTDYRGALMVIPGLNHTYNYPNYHHITQMLPLKDEFVQKSSSSYNNEQDCAAQSVAWDDSSNTYGRKQYYQTYSYTFCKRGEKPSGNNWFILYVQVVGTFRPFDAYFGNLTFDYNNYKIEWNIAYNQTGFSNTQSIASQINNFYGYNFSQTTGSSVTSNTTTQDKINSALSVMKDQYYLKLTDEEQDELFSKDANNNYVYDDGDRHAIRYGFTNVSLSAKAGSSTRVWHEVSVCEQLAKAIYIADTYSGSGNWWDNDTVLDSYDDVSGSRWEKFLNPETAGKWLANNILDDTTTWRVRKIDDSGSSPSYLKHTKLLNITGSSGTVGSLIWSNRLYEKMYPTISQVRCHIFTPGNTNNYARYEKYCVNDYGQIMEKWTEKVAVNGNLWAKYANIMDSVVNDIDSEYIRYDNHNYYFDFYHDPHHGKPDVPFPNKE